MAPGYVELMRRGELHARVEAAREILRACQLCPRACGINRLEDERGACHTGRYAVVSACHPHFGEEDPLTGHGGSGTLFMAWCNLRCVFCQNWEVSHQGSGGQTRPERLAEMMLHLQEQGCHNINFVSPSHVVAQILEAVEIAAHQGLHLPLVYNTGGFDRVDTLRLLDNVFDIYLPDLKYASAHHAQRYSGVEDYPNVVQRAVKEMHRQVGDLKMDAHGIAIRGLLVRHLVLPDNLAGTREVMEFLAHQISPHTYVNIMAQYHPCGEASRFPELMRRPTQQEWQDAVHAALDAGLTRLDDRRLMRFLRTR